MSHPCHSEPPPTTGMGSSTQQSSGLGTSRIPHSHAHAVLHLVGGVEDDRLALLQAAEYLRLGLAAVADLHVAQAGAAVFDHEDAPPLAGAEEGARGDL